MIFLRIITRFTYILFKTVLVIYVDIFVINLRVILILITFDGRLQLEVSLDILNASTNSNIAHILSDVLKTFQLYIPY